ncbi:hypothetical protein [Paraburkholderia xenovorans]|uniref:hypothetical protein n=1 Tax=Paraburkholderia xenovorans TaxID=36873 RepID=UPI0038BBD423
MVFLLVGSGQAVAQSNTSVEVVNANGKIAGPLVYNETETANSPGYALRMTDGGHFCAVESEGQRPGGYVLTNGLRERLLRRLLDQHV